MRDTCIRTLLATAALAGCATGGGVAPVQLGATGETAPTTQSDANTAVVVPRENGGGLVIGSSETTGIELYDLDGARIAAIAAGATVGVDARYGAPSERGWIVAALDGGANRLRLFELDAEAATAQERTLRPVPVGFAAESLCLYRDARDSTLYAFVLGGEGEIAQFSIAARDGGFDATLVRQLRVPSEASYCTADDASGALYVAEQGVGVWRFDADPEAEIVPQLIDAVRLGRITEETGGVAVYNAGETSYLVVSDASAGRFHLYDRNADDAFIGTFTLAQASAPGAVVEAGGLSASSHGYGAGYPQGMLLALDEGNEGGANYKLVSWAEIADAFNLPEGTRQDPRVAPSSTMPFVRPIVETAAVETAGDSADDPAIWVDPNNPSRSIVIGTQKQSGLYVYDLHGQVLQFLPDGRMNNVDVRDGFRLGDRLVSLVAASNRTTDSISLYRVDPATRRLVNVADGQQDTGLLDPYGLCMYHSAASGRHYVFVNDGGGAMRQWELIDAGNGRVRANLVREFAFASQPEGCFADDRTGALYVGEEDVGLWRMGAEPDAGDARTAVATVETNPALKADIEGVGLYDLGDGRGYLIVSSQGNNTYAVFRREGNNEYVGSFAVLADSARGIDGSSETDGLEVLSANLGGPFANGIFVAQDGRNVAPPENQNFKLVPWSAIAEALGLESR